MSRILHLMMSLAVLVVPCAEAQSLDTPLADRIVVGTVVTVTDEAGKATTGRVQGVSADVLSLSRRSGVEAIPVSTLVRIEKPDRLVNGALIGMTLGMFFGIVGGTLDAQGSGDRDAFIIVSTLGNTVIWTALGTAVDAIFNNKRTLYERGRGATASVGPLIGPGTKGASLSLTW